MDKVTVRTITKDTKAEIESVREARMRGESVMETETMMLHTILYADGSGSVARYTKNRGETEWKLAAREHFKTEEVPA